MPRGGKRKGAGRKPLYDTPLIEMTILVTDEHAKLLRRYGRGNLSAGIRWLIEASAPLIRKVGEDEIEALHNSD